MKAIYLLLLIGSLVHPCQAQNESGMNEEGPAVRVSLGAALGLAVSGRPQETTGVPITGLFMLPIELRKHWFIIPEMYTVGFRTPNFQRKVGLIAEAYPRLRHEIKDLRVGKGFGSRQSKWLLVPSAGFGLLEVFEPYVSKKGSFGPVIEDNAYRTYVFPLQMDIRLRSGPQSVATFVAGARWNLNQHRPFGSFTTGIEVDLEAQYRRRIQRKSARKERRQQQCEERTQS